MIGVWNYSCVAILWKANQEKKSRASGMKNHRYRGRLGTPLGAVFGAAAG